MMRVKSDMWQDSMPARLTGLGHECSLDIGQRLAEIVRPGMLCGFDFDGTLAPIGKDPDAVRISPGIARSLARLAALTPVAIISGRSVSDLQARLPFMPRYVVGNHGLEGVPGMSDDLGEHVGTCREWMAILRKELGANECWSRYVVLENKGASLTLHFRLAPDREEVESGLRRMLRDRLPVAYVVGGKCVLNLLPRADVNKAVALTRLAEDCNAPTSLFAGDDLTDEPVFLLPRHAVLGIRIGQAAGSGAEYCLDHRLLLAPLLDQVCTKLEALRAG